MDPLIVAIVITVVIFLFAAFLKKENMISEPAYALTSRGLNLPSRGGYYLGGLAVLDSAENADRTDQVVPHF